MFSFGGYFAVEAFFVMSGILLTINILKKIEKYLLNDFKPRGKSRTRVRQVFSISDAFCAFDLHRVHATSLRVFCAYFECAVPLVQTSILTTDFYLM